MGKIDISLPVKFLSAGEFIAKDGWVHQRRNLESSMLIVVESGRFVMNIAGERIEIGPREAVILPANVEHVGEPIMQNEMPIYYWAHFMPKADLSGCVQKVSMNMHTICSNYDKISIVFRQLISESYGNEPLLQACDYYLSILMVYIAAESEVRPVTKALYVRIKEYLRMNYHLNISLNNLAEEFHYSTDYLSRLFKKNANMSVGKYIHSLRLNEAKQLLLSTTDSVRSIGFRCGYTNEKYFITTFTKSEGMTPTQYRNLFGILHQNNH